MNSPTARAHRTRDVTGVYIVDHGTLLQIGDNRPKEQRMIVILIINFLQILLDIRRFLKFMRSLFNLLRNVLNMTVQHKSLHSDNILFYSLKFVCIKVGFLESLNLLCTFHTCVMVVNFSWKRVSKKTNSFNKNMFDWVNEIRAIKHEQISQRNMVYVAESTTA